MRIHNKQKNSENLDFHQFCDSDLIRICVNIKIESWIWVGVVSIHSARVRGTDGSRSGIWCPFNPWFRDPGWTSRVIFSRASKQFFGVKYLPNSLMLMRIRFRDPGIFLTLDPGWKQFGSRINIPDPQHCYNGTVLCKIVRKTLISTLMWFLLWLWIFEEWCKCTGYLQNVKNKKNQKNRKNIIFCWRLQGPWRKEQDPKLDPDVRGTDPRIRICTKMSRIRTTAF